MAGTGEHSAAETVLILGGAWGSLFVLLTAASWLVLRGDLPPGRALWPTAFRLSAVAALAMIATGVAAAFLLQNRGPSPGVEVGARLLARVAALGSGYLALRWQAVRPLGLDGHDAHRLALSVIVILFVLGLILGLLIIVGTFAVVGFNFVREFGGP